MNGARPHTGTQGCGYKETYLGYYWGHQAGGAGQHPVPYSLLLLYLLLSQTRTCTLLTLTPGLSS